MRNKKASYRTKSAQNKLRKAKNTPVSPSAAVKVTRSKEYRATNKTKLADDPDLKDFVNNRKRKRYQENEEVRHKAIASARQHYACDLDYRKAAKKKSVDLYANDPVHQENVKTRSKQKYQTNEEHKKDVQTRSKHKYQTNEEHKKDVQTRSKHKYQTNEEHKNGVQTRSKHKYQTNEEHKKEVQTRSKRKYATDDLHREHVKKRSQKQYKENAQHRENVIKHAKASKRKKRAINSVTENAIHTFRENCKDGLKYICASCHRILFENQVIHCAPATLKCSDELKQKCVSDMYVHKCNSQCNQPCTLMHSPLCKLWICHTCKSHLSQNNMPPECFANNLYLERRPVELETLNSLEMQLISLNIGFMHLVSLPQAGERGVKGPVTLVQSNLDRVQTSLQSLPRNLADSSIIGVKLKRRLAYKSYVEYQLVNVGRVENALTKLKEINPLYADIHVNTAWAKGPSEISCLLQEDTESNIEPGTSKTSQDIQMDCENELEIQADDLNTTHKTDADCERRPTLSGQLTIGEKDTDVEDEMPDCNSNTQAFMPFDETSNNNLIDAIDAKSSLCDSKSEDIGREVHNCQHGNNDVSHGDVELENLLGTGQNAEEQECDDNNSCHDNTVSDSPTPSDNEDSSGSDEDDTDALRGLKNDSCIQPIDPLADAMAEVENAVLSIAPAENNKPQSILTTPKAEAKTFPALFPTSKNTFEEEREKKLGKGRYYNNRLFSADLRFAQNTQYIFYAQYMVELERLISGMSISMRKGGRSYHGKPMTAEMLADKRTLYGMMQADEGYRYMQAVRGSPDYWSRTMKDLMAQIRQCGLPTFFATFSCAELSRWREPIENIQDLAGTPVDFDDIDWATKCKILRSNPVVAVRMFYHRVHLLITNLIRGPSNPISNVVDHFYRVEFQLRGAPHIHCLFWVKNGPVYGKSSDEEIVDFVDRYITCEMPDEEDDPELHQIVSSVQVHRKKHTKSCKKGKSECRFNFPKSVNTKTFLARPEPLESDVDAEYEIVADGESYHFKLTKEIATDCLEDLKKLLKDDSNSHLSAQQLLIKARINTSHNLQQAMELLAKKPSIVLKRETKEIYVNNYNRDLLRAWNANIDLQYCLDAHSVVMYILSYISKSEKELGDLLKETFTELREQGNSDIKKVMRQLGFVYFQKREVSIQEAVVRTCGLPLKQCSRDTIFIATDENSTRLSKPLAQINAQASKNKDDENVWMNSLQDRYLGRTQSPLFNDMCQATFASHYRVLSKPEATRALNNKNPNAFQLQNDLGCVMKRTRGKPAVIRFMKHSPTKYPEKYYLTLLKLYLPHRNTQHLKPPGFDTYEAFFKDGAVALSENEDPRAVKDVVKENQKEYDKNSSELDDAWQTLQNCGPLEDAWSQIAPQTEMKRLDDMAQKVSNCENDDEIEQGDMPDLFNSEKSQTVTSLCSVELLGDSVRSTLKLLNEKQQDIFYFVRKHCMDIKFNQSFDPFHLYISAPGGCGKSFLIKSIVNESHRILQSEANPEATTILLCAPTGTAAFNIGGFTIHSALKIPRNLKSYYEPLGEDALNTLRVQLGNVKILIIDEVSMVDRRLMAYIHGHLSQITRVRSTSTLVYFGNISVLAVGDFYQLPPVKSTSIVIPDSSQGIDVWHDLFYITFLDEIMRQKDDAPFAELLNRLRLKCKNESVPTKDESVLQSRTAVANEPDDALHVFATNKKASAYNARMLLKLSTSPRILHAKDYEKPHNSGKLVLATKKGQSGDLLDVLTMEITARVMLIRNIDVSDGLVNGAFGTVVGFQPSDPQAEIKGIFVKFDSEKVGRKRVTSNVDQGILIEIHEEPMASNKKVTRRQYPLKLAWGCTIHKTQGMTTDQCVFDMEGVFASGQSYVALSRVTSLKGLFIQNYDPGKIFKNEAIHQGLMTMQEHPQIKSHKLSHAKFTVLHQNVQGLQSKLADIQNRSKALSDVMMFSETFLKSAISSANININNYVLQRKERTANTGRGGLAIYIKDSIPFSLLPTADTGLEHMMIRLHNVLPQDILVVLLYRPPTQKLSQFNQKLLELLSNIDASHHDVPILIAGDLNENLLDDRPHPIFDLFKQHKYHQQVNDCTTSYGTLLDVVYTRYCDNMICNVLPTYYSDHEAMKVSFFSVENFQQFTEAMKQPDKTPRKPYESSSEFTQMSVQHVHDKHSEHTHQPQQSRKTKSKPHIRSAIPKTTNIATPPKTPAKAIQKKQSKRNTQRNVPSTNVASHAYPKLKGIVNLGNTCYANVFLQIFFHTEHLQPLLKSGLPLSNCLQQLWLTSQDSTTALVNPVQLFSMPRFVDWPVNVQQDTHEFFIHTIQSLVEEETLANPNVTPAARRTVYGELTHILSCDACGNETITSEVFNYLSSPIQPDSANQIILEPSEQQSDRPCGTCNISPTTCNTEITQPPLVLFVLLVRFDNNRNKIHARVHIDEYISTKHNTRYELTAVVQHHGRTTDSGHYNLLLKHPSERQWYLCCDHSVCRYNLPKTSPMPYLLVYNKMS